ncbi:iron-sulfur cluster repair di-iron protein [Reichenbachiella sp. MALMAid0571]|uniref:iron-sulfur cluster repair di-iron protein n=1 Tax=Reichenbachiella sp. MALMAid0571 TaxID=3143939 RepID=UPI0032DFC4FB
MEVKQNQIIGELVAQDYRIATVFKNHNIDFCCKGNRTLHEVCKEEQMEPSDLINEIEAIFNKIKDTSADYKTWPIDLLADYIEKKHHRYVEDAIVEINPYLDKITEVHGETHPELFEIKEHFKAASGELAAHMKKEEFILFPYVRKMVKTQQDHSLVERPHFGTVQNPIQMMMHEHETEGDRFGQIAKLSNNYTPPEDACNTYIVTFALLKEFEEDLHLHIHLENNILFPKAVELEKELKSWDNKNITTQ